MIIFYHFVGTAVQPIADAKQELEAKYLTIYRIKHLRVVKENSKKSHVAAFSVVKLIPNHKTHKFN